MSQSCLIWLFHSIRLLFVSILHVESLYSILPDSSFLFVNLGFLVLIEYVRKYPSRWQNSKKIIRHAKVRVTVQLISLFVSG